MQKNVCRIATWVHACLAKGMAAGNKCYTLSQEAAAYWAICSHLAVLPPSFALKMRTYPDIYIYIIILYIYIGLTTPETCLATGGRCQLATFSQTCGSISTKPVHLVYVYPPTPADARGSAPGNNTFESCFGLLPQLCSCPSPSLLWCFLVRDPRLCSS